MKFDVSNSERLDLEDIDGIGYSAFFPDAAEFIPIEMLINKEVFVVGARHYVKDEAKKTFIAFIVADDFHVVYTDKDGVKHDFMTSSVPDSEGDYKVYNTTTAALAIVDKMFFISARAKIDDRSDVFDKSVRVRFVTKKSKENRFYYDLE